MYDEHLYIHHLAKEIKPYWYYGTPGYCPPTPFFFFLSYSFPSFFPSSFLPRSNHYPEFSVYVFFLLVLLHMYEFLVMCSFACFYLSVVNNSMDKSQCRVRIVNCRSYIGWNDWRALCRGVDIKCLTKVIFYSM